jgi:drug/metabolite transporter (DMT)-like permease
MNNLIAILFIVIIGRGAIIFEKQALESTSDLDPITVVWFIYGLGFLFVTAALAVKKTNPTKAFTDEKYFPAFKWLILSAFCAMLYSIVITPLLKSMDYSQLTALKGPLAMIVSILAGILVFKENVTWNMWAAVGLFTLAALVSQQDIVDGFTRLARLRN